ncbi:MAG TPA: tetratricopeptide repeat protein [Thermodesulfovibrionales bacterium]|nr:tetratricopeptide repeat protein [Thermodesulfovibrionales bacterium]
MKTEVSARYQVIFIIFIAFGIYYPSLFGQANSVDDIKMMTHLFSMQHVDLKNLFFPMKPFHYYRPVLFSTFIFDKFVFFCSESFMHLHNIVLHTANGVLVFYIVREMIRMFRIAAKRYVPMFTSLLFVLHPVNTEAVNWISGRTDVLAGTFVFLAFFIFLRKGFGSIRWCWAAAFFYLLGLLSKEVALGLLPAVGLFLILKEEPVETLSARRRFELLLPFLLITLLYFVMRSVASGHSHSGFVTATGVTESRHLQIGAGNAVKAFGFYIKKLFIPVPLNFCIMQIHGMFYFWFGLAMGAVAVYLLLRKRALGVFLFLFSIIFFLPSIPIAMNIIEAWTPLGERYLYISSFGASALVVILSEKIPLGKKSAGAIMALLLLTAAFITANRNIIWQDNLTLFEDTVKKSPKSAAARNEYAAALTNKGRYDEAFEQFTISARLAGKIKYREVPSLNTLLLKGPLSNPEEIKDEYRKLLEDIPEASVAILRNFTRFLDSRAMNEKDPAKRAALFRELISFTGRLFEVERTGFTAYRIGQLHLALGENKEAVKYFRLAIELSPNEYFSDPARRLIRSVDAGT